jgi:tetratricopeptide (TPR) repeat protein
MENTNLDDTRAHRAGAEPEPPPEIEPIEKPRKRKSFPLIALGGVLILFVIAGISGYSGYLSGLDIRTSAEATQAASLIDEQFQLGMQEFTQGEFFRARQRFEYVIQMNPDHPQAPAMLAETLTHLNSTATPTVAPTPTMTPTPDLRDVEQLFLDGQQFLMNGEWDAGIDSFLRLRKADPEYQKVAIDDMLFLALRNRGWDKITKQADLEGGIYDLTLAERFGPLDTNAQGLLTWARIYITGASFWELDWEQAVFYFAQVAPQMPAMVDGSGWTAAERYRIALSKYGDMLAENGQWCDAQAQLELSLSYGYDAEAEDLLNEAIKQCQGDEDEDEDESADAEETPPPAEEVTPEPTVEAPTAEPPAEPTAEAPAETPTP